MDACMVVKGMYLYQMTYPFCIVDRLTLMDSKCFQISDELAVRMYTYMAMLQTMDTIFYEAQRQGRISFYVTAIGEEAINIASAAALQLDDPVFPQVIEHKAILQAFLCIRNAYA